MVAPRLARRTCWVCGSVGDNASTSPEPVSNSSEEVGSFLYFLIPIANFYFFQENDTKRMKISSLILILMHGQSFTLFPIKFS